MKQSIALLRRSYPWFVNHSMLNQPKDRRIAAVLAFAGILLPGLHKFYLGQPKWGIAYLLLSWTPVSKIASATEGFWYLFQDREAFDRNFNGAALPNSMELSSITPASGLERPASNSVNPIHQVTTVAEAVRQIEQLRQEGLISEFEFEQKRRQLLDRIG